MLESSHCIACAQLASLCCDSVSDASLNEWDSHSYPTDAIRNDPLLRGTSRLRRINGHLKEAVVHRARKWKALASRVAEDSLDGVRMKRANVDPLGPYILGCWDKFGGQGKSLILNASADASDFGYPCEDTMIYAFSDGLGSSCWGLPMVFLLGLCSR